MNKETNNNLNTLKKIVFFLLIIFNITVFNKGINGIEDRAIEELKNEEIQLERKEMMKSSIFKDDFYMEDGLFYIKDDIKYKNVSYEEIFESDIGYIENIELYKKRNLLKMESDGKNYWYVNYDDKKLLYMAQKESEEIKKDVKIENNDKNKEKSYEFSKLEGEMMFYMMSYRTDEVETFYQNISTPVNKQDKFILFTIFLICNIFINLFFYSLISTNKRFSNSTRLNNSRERSYKFIRRSELFIEHLYLKKILFNRKNKKENKVAKKNYSLYVKELDKSRKNKEKESNKLVNYENIDLKIENE